MNLLRRKFLFLLWTIFLAYLPGPALAQQWASLKTIDQVFYINGVETKSVFYPELKTETVDDRLKAHLRVRGDLNDFRRIAPEVTLWKQPLAIFNTALVLKGRDLRPDPPGVIAEGLLFLAGTSEATTVRARLTPEILDNAVRLRAESVGRMKEGLLKSALEALGLAGADLNPMVYLLNRWLSDETAYLNFPPELKRFEPVFESVSFNDPGSNGLGLKLNARFNLKPEDLPYLIDHLAHIGD